MFPILDVKDVQVRSKRLDASHFYADLNVVNVLSDRPLLHFIPMVTARDRRNEITTNTHRPTYSVTVTMLVPKNMTNTCTIYVETEILISCNI